MNDKERKKEYDKKWYQENRERMIRRQKDYYQNIKHKGRGDNLTGTQRYD